MPQLPEDPLAEYLDLAAHYNHALLHNHTMTTHAPAEEYVHGIYYLYISVWIYVLLSYHLLSSAEWHAYAIIRGNHTDPGPWSLVPRSIPVGWCSWYHFYDKISETNLQANLTMMASLKGTPLHPPPLSLTISLQNHPMGEGNG